MALGSLPELRTDYGPDLGKVAATANVLDQMQRRKALQNALSTYRPGSGPSQDAIRNALALSPEVGVHLMATEAQMGKRGAEEQLKGAELKLKQIESADKMLNFGIRQLQLANIDNYPQIRSDLVAADPGFARHLPDPSVFTQTENPQKDFEQFKQYTLNMGMTVKDRLAQAKLELEKTTPKMGPTLYGEGDTKQSSVIMPGQGVMPVGGRAKIASADAHLTAKSDQEYQELIKQRELGQVPLSPEQEATLTSYEARKFGQAGGIKPFSEWDEKDRDTSYDKWMILNEKPRFSNRDPKSINEWERGLRDYMSRYGIDMGDVALSRADIKGGTASLINQKKVRGMMGSFVRNIDKQISRIDEITSNIDRIGVRGLDVPWRELKTRAIGSADEKILEAYVAEISREIGKLTTGSSASIAELSVEAQKKWDKIHDVNLTLPELKRLLEETRHMGDMRLQSADEEISATRQSLKSSGGKPPAVPSPSAAMSDPSVALQGKPPGTYKNKAGKIIKWDGTKVIP